MRRLFLLALALLFMPGWPESSVATAHDFSLQDNQNTQANTSGSEVRKRHKRRRHRRHIKQSYKQAGQSTAEGGRGFGRNIKHGKPIKAGKVFGRNMKTAGQNVGQGSKQVGDTVVDKSKTVGQKSKETGQKVVDKTKKVVKPPQ